MNKDRNQLYPELLGLSSIQSFLGHDSSPRLEMMRGHLAQCLVFEGANVKRILTGKEIDYGRYTFKSKLNCNATIIDIIEKYPKTFGYGSILENPKITVVYQNVDTGEYDYLDIDSHHTLHQNFGFKFKRNKEAIQKLTIGAAFPKDTIFAQSPNIVEDGAGYTFGIEANVAFMSVPGVTEDGIVVSKSFAEKLKTRTIETRTINFGKDYYPLNLYGDSMSYKPFPDIGEKIRDDGLLFALREYNQDLGVADMSLNNLKNPDYFFDKLTYGEGGAKIIDIDVRHNTHFNPSPTPVGMEEQPNKYYQFLLNYYKKIIEAETKIFKTSNGKTPNLSPKFRSLIIEAKIFKPSHEFNRINQIYQRTPLDNWRVSVVFEKITTPTRSFKITGLQGDKGVICTVRNDEDMPVDDNGNVADAIMDGTSTIKRNNVGRLYEQYINATSRYISENVRNMMASNDSNKLENCWNYLMGYYKIVSPKMFEIITSEEYKKSKKDHIEDIVKDGVYLFIPTNNETPTISIIQQLRASYPIPITPVTYKSEDGTVYRTKKPVIIGSIYILLLEKTGKELSAVSSTTLNMFGIPSKLTRMDRYNNPIRQQPGRFYGEAECRLIGGVIGGESLSEILHQSNSPLVHREICSNILKADQPSNIESVVDSTRFSSTDNRPISFINNTLMASGIRFYRKKEKYEE